MTCLKDNSLVAVIQINQFQTKTALSEIMERLLIHMVPECSQASQLRNEESWTRTTVRCQTKLILPSWKLSRNLDMKTIRVRIIWLLTTITFPLNRRLSKLLAINHTTIQRKQKVQFKRAPTQEFLNHTEVTTMWPRVQSWNKTFDLERIFLKVGRDIWSINLTSKLVSKRTLRIRSEGRSETEAEI